MFRKQVEELREMVVEKEIIINRMEEEIKSQKELLKDAGAKIIVAGSSIINSANYEKTISKIKETI